MLEGVYPKICVNYNEAVQNTNQLRASGQRIYPMSACVHHSMPDVRSQGRREAPFIGAPLGAQTLDAVRPVCYLPSPWPQGLTGIQVNPAIGPRRRLPAGRGFGPNPVAGPSIWP